MTQAANLGALGTNATSTGGLTGANLGTPSALVLTNATSLPKAALPTGSVLQVVQSSNLGNTGYNSSTYIDTGLSVSITPSSASNKILVLANLTGMATNTSGSITGTFAITDASNNVIACIFDGYLTAYNSTTIPFGYSSAFILHSPATTSSYTYKLRVKCSNSIQITDWIGNSTQACNITLMEIAG